MSARHVFWAMLAFLALAMPARSQDHDPNVILGEWKGRYACVPDGLEVTITTKLRGQVREGLVSLGAPGAKKPTAIFTVRAALKPGGLIQLDPVNWRRNPNRYKAVTLIGKVSPDGKKYTGEIRDCGSFEFSRTKAMSDEDRGKIARGEDDPRKHKEKACQKLPDAGKRLDCIVEARNTPLFGRGIPNEILRKSCESAFRDFNPEATPQCLGGIVFIDRRRFTGSDLIKEAASCRQFIARAHQMIQDKFPMETVVWRRQSATPTMCENLDAMRASIGAPALNTCRRSGGDAADELANCTGIATADPEFARMWATAFEECTTGKQIGMYRILKQTRYENLQFGLFNMDCDDVFALVEKYKIVDKPSIENGRQQMAALEGNRPPRDDEVIEALKVAMTKKYNCDDGGHQFNSERFGCNIGYGRSREGAIITDTVNKTFGEMANDGVTVKLGLVGAELFSCAGSGGTYTCTYGIELTCNIAGIMTDRSIDLTAAIVEKRHCPQYTDPPRRESVFTWQGDRYVTSL